MTTTAALNKLYSDKQQEVLRYALKNDDWFMLINHGAKRSGKTVVDNDLFLMELQRVRDVAKADGVLHPQYILAGADLGALNRNVISELQNRYALDFHFDKWNRFELLGVQVCCFGHSKLNDLGRIRGMTAYGAYINEATVAHQQVFNEIRSRCSARGARLIMDTNPDRPSHYLKTDFIDKADRKTIKDFSRKLTDNCFLPEKYIADIKKTTPSGMFYDRDINGAWVSAAGVVYPDFSREENYISSDALPPMERHFAGVDFGWEHYGSIVLFGVGVDEKIYLLQEWSAKHRHITEWATIAQGIIERCGDILFYCDSARPDLIDDLLQAGIRAVDARKDVMGGIATVASLFKQRRLLVVRDGVTRFDDEIDKYAWKDGADAPIKENDDTLDAVRYGIYTDAFYEGR